MCIYGYANAIAEADILLENDLDENPQSLSFYVYSLPIKL